MSARATQFCIGAVFAVLGGWALLFPNMVIGLGVRREYHNDDLLSALLMGCFGAQACLFALVAFTARFTRLTFAAYGIALLPFFVFNYWFYFQVPVFNEFMLIDFVGNVIMLALCWNGWRAAAE